MSRVIFSPRRNRKYSNLRRQTGNYGLRDVWNDKNFWAVRRYDRDPVTELVGQGTSVLINISASPYTIDKRALRVDMLRSIAMNHQLPIVYVNQVGGNDSLIFDGASVALTLDGKVRRKPRPLKKTWCFSIPRRGKVKFTSSRPKRLLTHLTRWC